MAQVEYLDKTGLSHLISKIKTDYVSNSSLTKTLESYQPLLTKDSIVSIGHITLYKGIDISGMDGTSINSYYSTINLFNDKVSGYAIVFYKDKNDTVKISLGKEGVGVVQFEESTVTGGVFRPVLITEGKKQGYFVINSEVSSMINAIPSPGNGTLSFKINGNTLTTKFSANQSTNVEVDLGSYLTEDSANTKYVKKTTNEKVVYATDSTGSDTTFSFDEGSSSPNTIAMRNQYGNILVGEPKTSQDATNKGYVDSAIKGITQFKYEIVSTLPTASVSTMGKIYLVYHQHKEGSAATGSSSAKDTYDEFITIETGTTTKTYSWETIGNTDIDLSHYVPTARTINGHDLTKDITLEASDILTTDQLNAANSGITKSKVTKYDGYESQLSTISSKFGDYLPVKNPTIKKSNGDNYVVFGDDKLYIEDRIPITCKSGSILLNDGEWGVYHIVFTENSTTKTDGVFVGRVLAYVTGKTNIITLQGIMMANGYTTLVRTPTTFNVISWNTANGILTVSNTDSKWSQYITGTPDQLIAMLGDHEAISNTDIDTLYAAA